MSKNNELRELIDLIKHKTGKTQAEIADDAGYKRTYISEALSKPRPPDKLLTKLKLTYSYVLNADNNGTSDYIMKEPALGYKKDSKPNKENLSIQAIVNLTESNRMMAESILIDARTRESLSRSHEELIQMAKGSTVNGATETLQAVGAKLIALQEFVLEQSVKKAPYHSKQEAQASLNIKTSEALKHIR
jgi:hypothetical protein